MYRRVNELKRIEILAWVYVCAAGWIVPGLPTACMHEYIVE